MRADKIFPFLFVGFLAVSNAAQSDSAFERTQGTVTRTGYSFFGGQVAALDVGSTGIVYAGFNSPSGVFCSSDHGQSWSAPATGTDLGNIHGMTVDHASGTAFAIGGTKLFRSTDTCVTWTELIGASSFSNYSFAVVYSNSLLLVGNRNGTIDRSTNPLGATPTFTNVTIDSSGSYIQALAPSAADGEFLALVTVNGANYLYKSTGQGSSWSSLNKSGNYWDVSVDPQNANLMILSAQSGSDEFSTDGGAHWSTISNSASGGHAARFVNVSVGGSVERRVYINSNWTTDLSAFASFHSTATDATYDTQPDGYFVSDPSDQTKLYSSSAIGVARSSDSGLSFHDSETGIRGVQINRIAQSSDKNLVYMATGQGLARTTNFLNASGPTWEFPFSLNSFDTPQQFYAALIDKQDSNIVYVGTSSAKIYRSSNGGTSWTKVYDPNTDGGSDILDLYQVSDGTLYAAFGQRAHASGGVLKSTDGITWTNVSSTAFDGYVHALTGVGNTLFAALGQDQEDGTTAQRGIWKYDGTSWSQVSGIPTTQIIGDVRAAGNTIIAAGAHTGQNGNPDPSNANGAVFRSADAGVTWTDVTANGLRTNGGWYRTVAFDPTNTNIVYVAHGRPSGTAEIYRSSD